MSEPATRDWKIHGERRQLPALLGALKDAALGELHQRLREEGHAEIRPGHGCVFRFIDAEGARLTELAERAQMTKQAVGEVVTDLERMGYVERVADPTDGRAKIIRLTERGWDAARAAERIFADIERRWATLAGEERVRLLRETLEEILDAELPGALPAAGGARAFEPAAEGAPYAAAAPTA